MSTTFEKMIRLEDEWVVVLADGTFQMTCNAATLRTRIANLREYGVNTDAESAALAEINRREREGIQ